MTSEEMNEAVNMLCEFFANRAAELHRELDDLSINAPQEERVRRVGQVRVCTTVVAELRKIKINELVERFAQ